MSSSHEVWKGIIHGRTIELEQAPGLPNGQSVTVVVVPRQVNGAGLAPGEGIRRSAGAWSEDTEDLDQFLDWNRQQRKVGRREVPE